jgi:hypothetical protein
MNQQPPTDQPCQKVWPFVIGPFVIGPFVIGPFVIGPFVIGPFVIMALCHWRASFETRCSGMSLQIPLNTMASALAGCFFFIRVDLVWDQPARH